MTTRLSAVLVALAIAALAVGPGCGKNGSPSGPAAQPAPPAASPPATPWPAPPERVGDDELATLVADQRGFALDLLGRLGDGNLAFSPASVGFALAMTYAGARSETAAEMKSALHFSQAPERLHASFADLISRLMPGAEAEYELAIANQLWGNQGTAFLPAFLDLATRFYNAKLEELDFAGAPEPARKRINQWVEERTRGRIKDLLAEGTITAITRLVLTNAIYFKGKWWSPFEKQATTAQPFYAASGPVEVLMMRQSNRFTLVDQPEVQVLGMPYRGGDLGLVVILPRARDGLAALEAGLTAEQLGQWLSAQSRGQVRVTLPKFETTSSIGLVEVLKAMGMKAAFDETADFSGMNGKTDLLITAVVHKAFVKVDEEGSEAAAATAVVVGEKSAAPAPPVDFVADHPFLFAIVHQPTGTILFLGRVVNPLG